MSRGLKNPYGLRNGVIVTADEVPNGLACGCSCPGCHEHLIANHGTGLKQPYFSHESGAECDTAYETALHLMAKEVLADLKRLRLPPLRVGVDGELVAEAKRKLGLLARRLVEVPASLTNPHIPTASIVRDGHYQNFDRVELEVAMDSIVPDVVMYVGTRRLLVEILVTHAVTEAKRKWLVENQVPAIEFDFSTTDRAITRDELKMAFLKSATFAGQGSASWIHHPLAATKLAELNGEFTHRYLAPINELVTATDPKTQATCKHNPVRRVGQDGIARMLCEKCWKFFSRIPETGETNRRADDDSTPLFK